MYNNDKDGHIYTQDASWRTTKRGWGAKLGTRVLCTVNPNGRQLQAFREAMSKVPLALAKPMSHYCRSSYYGTLIKAEWKYGHTMTQVRYTVKCDDGKVRKVQIIKST